jgi:hypothetical protein
MGSNQRLTQPQTVGKKPGAPTICGDMLEKNFHFHPMILKTYEYPVQCLWVVCCRQNGSILHVSLEVPELLQPDITDIHNVVALRDGCLRVVARYHGAEGRNESRERFV